MTPVPQCQWLGMFCTCPEPINLQQVEQLAQQCGGLQFCLLISDKDNFTIHYHSDHNNALQRSVVNTMW